MLFAQPRIDHPPTISFFGGEPLLEYDLLQKCVDYAEQRGRETGRPYELTITTNGLGLDEQVVRYLREKEIEITLSFDGVREAQDASRPRPDRRSSFPETRAALRLALEHVPDTAVCAVVSPENVRYLCESIDFLLDEGVRYLHLNPNFFADWTVEGLDQWRAGYEHAAQRVVEAFRNGQVVHVNFITAKIVTHLKGGYDPCDCCDFGRREIAIAPSGNVYPCQRMVGEDNEELGLLGDVFDGRDEQACRELDGCREVTSPECLECDHRARCRNWCSCVNHRLTGRFDRVCPLVCYHERMAIEVADAAASCLFEEKNSTFLQTFYQEEQVAPEWI